VFSPTLLVAGAASATEHAGGEEHQRDHAEREHDGPAQVHRHAGEGVDGDVAEEDPSRDEEVGDATTRANPTPTLVTKRAAMSAGKLPPSDMASATAIRNALARISVARRPSRCPGWRQA
jgi:hypothetical protein